MSEYDPLIKELKGCVKCKIEKIRTDFYKKKDSKDGLKSIYKSCISIDNKQRYKTTPKKYKAYNPEKAKVYRKKYYDKYKEKIALSGKNWAAKNPDKVKHRKLKYSYNLSIEEYKEMSLNQNHQCLICGKIKKLAVDHCHLTGKVRGLLCCKCNTGLGQFNDNEETLLNAIKYLKLRG